MLISEIPICANMNKSSVATSSFCMEHSVEVDFVSSNGLQRSFVDVGDNVGVAAVATLVMAKHNALAACLLRDLVCLECGLVQSKTHRPLFCLKKAIEPHRLEPTCEDALVDGVVINP